MTSRHQYVLQKIKEHIHTTKMMLRDILNGDDPLTENEYSKLRDAYDILDELNEKLPS